MPKKIDHTERKVHIVEAAFRIIYHYGFEKTTLREIAKEASISLGSVQYLFPKQKDIYMYAMEVIYQRFGERMERIIQVDQGAFENAVQMIRQIVQVKTEEERIENDIWLKFALMATMYTEYEETKKEHREVTLRFTKDILHMLDKAGYIKESINMEENANALTVFIHGLVFESVIYKDLYNDQVVERKIRDYLRNICQ